MIPAARAAAAIEVLADIETKRRPAADAMKDWGLSHRFAGSGDRAAIAGLVYDALRRKARRPGSWAKRRPARRGHRGAEAIARPRREEIAALFSGEGHAPRSLSEAERDAARRRRPRRRAGRMCAAIFRNGWRRISRRASAPSAAEEGRALAERAPVDLRVNTLKTDPRQGAGARSPISRPSPRRSLPAACASPCARTAARRRSPPSRPTSRASSRCRTRARSSPRCCRRRQARHAGARPLRRAPAARRWRSPR
jgi:16S rRNA (cytosine967-C5)-methyltransferase